MLNIYIYFVSNNILMNQNNTNIVNYNNVHNPVQLKPSYNANNFDDNNYRNNLQFNPYANIVNPPLNYDRPMPYNSTLNNPPGFTLNVPTTTYKNVNNTNTLPNNYNNANQMSPGYIACNDYDAPNVLQNNLNPIVMNKEVKEYPIYIDSIDRDITKYPNPFSYRVALNPTDNQIMPYIQQRFENVKYIKLERSILPKYYNLIKVNELTGTPLYVYLNGLINPFTPINTIQGLINTSALVGADTVSIVNITYVPNINPLTQWNIEVILNGNINKIYVYDYNNAIITYYSYQFDQSYNLLEQRWILVNIPEIDKITDLSTDDNIKKGFNVIYMYKDLLSYVEYKNGDVIWIYKNSDLDTYNSFTISYRLPNGTLLNTNYINTTIDTANNPNDMTTLNPDGTQNIIWRDAKHYIRHPYYEKLQNHILLKIGIYENDIDKNIFCYNK